MFAIAIMPQNKNFLAYHERTLSAVISFVYSTIPASHEKLRYPIVLSSEKIACRLLSRIGWHMRSYASIVNQQDRVTLHLRDYPIERQSSLTPTIPRLRVQNPF